MIPKLIFFDLDGTLINKSGDVSPATRHAIATVQELGCRIAFATGRPLFAAQSLLDELHIDGASLFFSGALLYDPREKTVIKQHALDKETLRSLIESARRYSLYPELYASHRYYADAYSPLAEIHYEYIHQYPHYGSLEDVIEIESILKFELILTESEHFQNFELFRREFSHLSIGVASGAAHPGLRFCNITHPQGSRESGFHALLAFMQCRPQEVMAFGDGESDIPFLRLAGCGVALGNAEASVRDAADYVTDDVEHDGVAKALATLVIDTVAR